jgi:hypothetical protein
VKILDIRRKTEKTAEILDKLPDDLKEKLLEDIKKIEDEKISEERIPNSEQETVGTTINRGNSIDSSDSEAGMKIKKTSTMNVD